MNRCFCYTQFEVLSNGLQVRYDKDSTLTRQFFPFTQIVSVRVEYNSDDKLSSLTLLVKDGLKFSYLLKQQNEAETLYDQIRSALP